MACKDHCVYCFDALICHFENKECPTPRFANDKYPLFVTWHKESSSNKEPSLRGCKGTFSAKQIHEGLKEFALISALKDKRFSPVGQHELPRLKCSVSLLFKFEECGNVWDWEIGTHGIIIDFADHKGNNLNATYLPEVALEQEWTKVEALKSLIKKAGYDGHVSDEFMERIQVTRYQSSIDHLHYTDYQIHKKGTH